MAKEPEIRSVYNPSTKQKEEIHMVYHRKEKMWEKRQDYEKDWDDYEKQYEAYIKDTDLEDWQSDYFVPLTASIIEAQLAEMTDQTSRPLILPRTAEDETSAMVMKKIFDYSWEIGDGDVELYKVVKDALVFGTGIAQEYYLSIPRKIQERIKVDKKGKEVFEEKEIKDYDNCYMEAVKLQDFFVDEKSRGFTGPYAARDCIRRYIYDIETFKKLFQGPIWDQFNAAKYVKPGGDTNYYEFFKPPEAWGEDLIEVLFYWNKPDDKLIVVANDILIRSSPNPFTHKELPFARAVDILNPHQFYGKGESSLLKSINKELNRLRRMRHDRLHLSIDQMFIVANREMLDENQLITRPHGKIEADDPANIVPLVYPDTPNSSYLEEDRIKDDAIRITGFDDRMASVQKPGTATEAAILKESTLKRIRLKLRLLERIFLTRIGRLRVSNIQQFYTVPKVRKIVGERELRKAQKNKTAVKIDGEDYRQEYPTIRVRDKKLSVTKDNKIIEKPYEGTTFFEVRPEMIRGQFDIVAGAGPTLPISKPLMQAKAQELHDRLLPLALQGIGYDPIKVMDNLIKAHDYNPDDFKPEGQEDTGAADEAEQQIQLAHEENQMVMQNKPIPPMGTPNASEGHTAIHIQFIESPEFMQIPMQDPRVQILAQHAEGETVAQQQRGQKGQMKGPGMQMPKPSAPGTAPSGSSTQSVMPGLVQGGEGVRTTPYPKGLGPQ